MPRRFLLIIFFLFLLIFLGVKIIPKLKGKEIMSMGFEVEEKRALKKDKKEVYNPPLVDLSLFQENTFEKKLIIGRNIFRYGVPKTNEKPTGQEREMGRNVPRATPRPLPESLTVSEAPQIPKVEPPPKREPPPFNFKYLGFFGPLDRKLAVFSDGKEIIDVFEGETIMDKFIVKKIGFESVTIGFVGFPEDTIQKVEVGP